METIVLHADLGSHAGNVGRVPREFNNNKQIKGVYLFITDTLRPKKSTWEEIAKEFCKEALSVTLEGKGSTRAACRMIQERWGDFVNWSKHKYRS
jgi:hypothetical protein